MNDSPLIVRGLTKTYKGVTSLRDLSFEVRPGEIFGLLGPNGAGKTTAIHTILGGVTPSSGDVWILGLSPFRDRDRVVPRVNFSSAYTQLPHNLSIEANLRIFADLYGVREPGRKVDTLLRTFKLTHRVGQLTGVLSSGEQTRLNLCKALLNDPEILFLDEPTASLDPDIAELVRRRLQAFQRERGLTIVYTSHNMAEVEQLCNRVLFLHKGRQVIQGSPAEVKEHFKKESLEKVFIHLARSEVLAGDPARDAPKPAPPPARPRKARPDGTEAPAGGIAARLLTVVKRYMLVHFRAPARLMDFFFWPVTELFLWGFLSLYMQHSDLDATGRLASTLINAIILWDILFQSQHTIALSFMEELWSRNIMNMLISPLRAWEWVVATCLYGVAKSALIILTLVLLAMPLYAFRPEMAAFHFIPLTLNLLLMGWAMGLFTTGLLLRWGHAADSLIWSVPFMAQPFSAIYFPLSVYPEWMKPFCLLLPSTHVMEGMRASVQTGVFPWNSFWAGLGLNAAFMTVGVLFCARMLARGREDGRIVRMTG